MPAYKMDPMRGNHGKYVAQEPISPLSPRSEAILAQRHSARQVSPLQSPSAPYPVPQASKRPAGNYTLPPKAYVMPTRKPVGGRGPPNKEEAIQSRPRSQSLRPLSELVAMPTGFLQDFTSHAPADCVQQNEQVLPQDVPTGFLQDFTNHAPAKSLPQQSQPAFQDAPIRRPRSQTLPSHIVEADLEAYRRRACAACGNLQGNSRQDFIYCKKCTNVYYCTVECWDRRVCHSRPSGPEKRCAVCGLRQSFAEHIFDPCGKCQDVGKAVYFCSDSCWDQRNCHIRAAVQNPAATPAQPPRTYHPGARSQQQQQQQREHLPKPVPGTHEGRGLAITRAPEGSHQDQGGRAVEKAPEEKRSWVDSKVFGVSVWIIIPVMIFIIILSLVLGLRG